MLRLQNIKFLISANRFGFSLTLISNLLNAKSSNELVQAQSQALAFTQATFEAEEINQTEKQSLEKRIRRIYRNQLIEESA